MTYNKFHKAGKRKPIPARKKSPQRWYSLKRFFLDNLGFVVHKLPVDAGFTCPNIDGTVGVGGCSYCVNRSFSPAHQKGNHLKPICDQVLAEMNLARQRYGAKKFLAYFQSFTNTHAPVQRLKEVYEQGMNHPDIIGMSIGTRPDAITDEALDLLEGYAKQGKHIWVELGLQSAHDETLDRVNRGHNYKQFEEAWQRLRMREGLWLCVHLIHGLPGENKEMMMKTVDQVAQLRPDGIKIHHLHLVDGAPLASEYRKKPFTLLDLEEYVSLVADTLERMPPKCALQRFVGEVTGNQLVAPKWNVPKQRILSLVDKELARRGTEQGVKYGASA